MTGTAVPSGGGACAQGQADGNGFQAPTTRTLRAGTEGLRGDLQMLEEGGFALQRFSPFLDPCPGASPLFTPSLQSCRSATNIQTPGSVRAPSAQQHAESSCSALTPGAAAEAGGRRRLSRNGSKPLHTQAVKCTHLGGKKPPTALLAARWRFLFCFQAKEETKLSEMDGRNSAEADGTWCLKVEAASVGGSVGGWVGEGGGGAGHGSSRATGPAPRARSEHDPSRAPLNLTPRKGKFQR